MNKQGSAVVFFGARLSADQYYDESIREETLTNGIKGIMSNVTGLRVETRNQLTCSIFVTGPERSIERLQNFLTRTGIGHLESGASKPALRAAEN